MTDSLTREQVERIEELFRLLEGTESPDECYKIIETACREGHQTASAALRTQLAQMTAKRDKLLENKDYYRHQRDEYKKDLLVSQQQLVERDATIARLEKEIVDLHAHVKHLRVIRP